jgi:hypothetical protein
MAFAATGLAIVAAGCGGSSGTTLTEKTLAFTEKQNDASFSFADNPPLSPAAKGEPKLSNGDQITFVSDLLDPSGMDVGDLDAVCIVTKTTTGSFDDSNAQCTGTAAIPGGTLTLTVGGAAFGAGTTRGAVVGGTGDYEGATGSFTSSDETGDRPSQDTFHLLVPTK